MIKRNNDISFNIGMSVSEDTVNRCCLLLGMYLTDHFELELISRESMTRDGERFVSVFTTRKEESEIMSNE